MTSFLAVNFFRLTEMRSHVSIIVVNQKQFYSLIPWTFGKVHMLIFWDFAGSASTRENPARASIALYLGTPAGRPQCLPHWGHLWCSLSTCPHGIRDMWWVAGRIKLVLGEFPLFSPWKQYIHWELEKCIQRGIKWWDRVSKQKPNTEKIPAIFVSGPSLEYTPKMKFKAQPKNQFDFIFLSKLCLHNWPFI